MSQTNTIQVNLRALTLILACVTTALLGFVGGWGIFGRTQNPLSAVPADALSIARTGGAGILRGANPEELSPALYTARFLQQYTTEYDIFIQPASLQGSIDWTGIPVLTWSGSSYIDVAMAARTQAGIVMLELRLVRQPGDAWLIDQLLGIQLREPAQ